MTNFKMVILILFVVFLLGVAFVLFCAIRYSKLRSCLFPPEFPGERSYTAGKNLLSVGV